MKNRDEVDSELLVFFIDASIYIFQAHFSPYIVCSNEKGEDLSALFGFTQFLIQLVRRIQPRFIAVAHDESLFTGFRHKLSPDYKSNRELPDENLGMQLAGCLEVSSLLGMSTFSSKVYEADDIIGTLATKIRLSTPNTSIQILTKDKDLAQLLTTEQDCLWDFSANKRRYSDDILNEFGISPNQFSDYLGLVGDAVDCISGVPGVGPVKAKILLQEFDSLEEIYRNIDEVSKLKIRGSLNLMNTLRENKEAAFLSKSLATIACNVDDENESFTSISLGNLSLRGIDRSAFSLFLNKYKFRESDKKRLQSMITDLNRQNTQD